MSFYNDNISVINDSFENIYVIQWSEGKISLLYFDKASQSSERKELIDGVQEDYSVEIDSEDNIYLLTQSIDGYLNLSTIKENSKNVIANLTDKPIPIAFNLNIFFDEHLHIIYSIMLDDFKNTYRIYHHVLEDNKWISHEVDDIKVDKLLNPFILGNIDDKLVICYYDFIIDEEEIFFKMFDMESNNWSEKIKLTSGFSSKLYIDFIYYKGKMHLVYSEYFEGNLVVKYERFRIEENKVIKEVEKVLSNPENCSYPIIVVYENKLWIVWVEYDSIVSRYSEDQGQSWSNLYLWKESKKEDIVRYKFVDNGKYKKSIKFNYSFGKVFPTVEFIGFGPLVNTMEVPLKKNRYINIFKI